MIRSPNSNNFDDIDPDRNMFAEHDFDQIFTNAQNTCEYFTIQQYENSYVCSNSDISIINYNIRSFHKNGEAFESFLDSVPFKHDIIVLSETWNSRINVKLCKIEGYNAFHAYREGRSGGVSIFYRNIYKGIELSEFSEISENIETCVARVDVGNFLVNVVGVYRPHAGTVDNFTDILTQKLDSLPAADLSCALGDFNINLTDHNSQSTKNFSSAMFSMHFFPHILKPTRFDASNPTCASTLDHIWISKILKSKSGVIYYDITDHSPTFLHLYCTKSCSEQNFKTFTFRPFSENNLSNLRIELAATNWDGIIGQDITDIHISTIKFSNFINALYKKHFPTKIKKISEKRLQKPWFSNEIKKCIKDKSDYFKLFKAGYISLELNNQMRNKVNRMVKKAKDSYYLNAFNRMRGNARKIWELIHDLSDSKKNRQPVSKLTVENITYADQLDIANKFNEFFTNIATDLDSQLPQTNLSQTSTVNITSQNNSFFLFPISVYECSNMIRLMKITKSNISTMPANFFSSFHDIFAYPVAKLINASLQSGVFPNSLKVARVAPVFKRGARDDPSNYRPISCLPYLSKIFERYMINSLNSFLHKNNIISKYQFGFQKNISTIDALICLIESIYNSLNGKKHHLNIFIDLRKAFDTMNHQILLQKLYNYGIRGLPLEWIQSYLRDRPCCVAVGGSTSSFGTTNIGIPQGSIVGPLLFLLYINDMPNVSKFFQTNLFADDTSLSASNDKFPELINATNSEISKIYNWTLSNRLTINVEKTEAIVFSNCRPYTEAHKVLLNGQSLNFAQSCKYLGVCIDRELNFKQHIDNVVGKLSRSAGILYKIKSALTEDARISYYYGMMYPYISYSIVVWGSTYKSHLQPLILQQKRIVRMIADAGFRDHCDPLLKRLGLLSVMDVFKFQLLVYMYNSAHKNKFNIDHDFQTRNRNFLRPNFHRLSKTQHAISFVGPTEWNKLPDHLKNIASHHLFKKKLKLFLLDQYAHDPG